MTKNLKERRKVVAVLQHAAHEHACAVLRAMQSQGIATRVFQLFRGETLPSSDEIQGLISLGGPMSCNDEPNHPWIRTELTLIENVVSKNIPFVGICLGGQLLSRALGSKVSKSPFQEIGWQQVRLSASGLEDPILRETQRIVFKNQERPAPAGSFVTYQWHEDAFEIPRECEKLAESEGCSNQAFRLNEKTYGFQFHPEADSELVRAWLESEDCPAQGANESPWIQPKETQLKLSEKMEDSNLILSLGIAHVFRKKPISEGQSLSEASIGKDVRFFVEGPDRKPFAISGVLRQIFNLSHGNYAVIIDSKGIKWPVRLEDVLI